MNGYWDFYEEAARAISFVGSDRLSHRFAGIRPIASPGRERDERWIDGAEEAIWPLLYQWHYLRDRRKAPDLREAITMREREDPEFVAALSKANRSHGILDPGWRVVSRGPDEYLCEKRDLLLRVSTAAVRRDELRPDKLNRDNEIVMIRLPPERRHWMPLYYCTAGGVTTEVNLRIYFNVKPASAAWLLEILSGEFHEAGASYQFKVLNHPRSYTRPDSAVLYLPLISAGLCRAIVDRVIAAGSSAFHTAIPALTRRIYPGIAVADEPPPVRGRQVSFGEHRCRLLARGIARSEVTGDRSLANTIEMICSEFTLRNLNPAQPFRSRQDYSAAADF